ncbi:MAG: site-specific integrase [Beijerinckiaceae bacterium]
MPELTRQQVERRVRTYFLHCIDRSHELADMLPMDRRTWDRDAEVATLRKRISELTLALTNREFSRDLEQDVLEILHGDEPDAKRGDLDTFRYACALVLRAKLQDAKLLAAELMGEPIGPSDPMFEGLRGPEFPLLPGEARRSSNVATQRAGDDEDAIAYEELFRRYRVQRQTENLAPRTILEFERAFRLGSEVIEGTRPINQIRAEDVRAVRDLIAALPANFDKDEAFAGMSAREAVEKNKEAEVRLIARTTQAKLFRFFMMPIRWAEKESYIASVPGSSITISALKRLDHSDIGRKPFDEAQLKLMFSSPLFTGCASESRRAKPGPYIFKDGWYWVPIIGFYTGMRLAEVVQLGADDVKRQEGIWFIDIQPGPIPKTGELKRVKNKAAIRQVPIVDDLIELGFLEMVKRAEQGGRLFPEIRFGHDGTPSKNFSKFWSRYGKIIGFHTPDNVFHSFRHNMVDTTRDARLGLEASNRVIGHTLPGARGLYGKGMSILPLKEEMDQIKPPIDLVSLLTKAQINKIVMPNPNPRLKPSDFRKRTSHC